MYQRLCIAEREMSCVHTIHLPKTSNQTVPLVLRMSGVERDNVYADLYKISSRQGRGIYYICHVHNTSSWKSGRSARFRPTSLIPVSRSVIRSISHHGRRMQRALVSLQLLLYVVSREPYTTLHTHPLGFCSSADPGSDGSGLCSGSKKKKDPREKALKQEFMERSYRKDAVSGRIHVEQPSTSQMMLVAQQPSADGKLSSTEAVVKPASRELVAKEETPPAIDPP